MVQIKKYFVMANYVDFALYHIRSRLPNFIVDRLTHTLEWEDIVSHIKCCEVATFNVSSEDLLAWVKQLFPEYLGRYNDFRHKKLIEYYMSYRILDPVETHVFMDAAGGIDGYLGRLKCRRRILQDLKINDESRKVLGEEVVYIQCDAGNIPLPDESIDRIACQHSFEHFQRDIDTAFIQETQRLLKVGGKCCIIPLFIADRYAEITDRISFRPKFDKDSTRILDPTSTIPGRTFSGNYARIYNLQAFQCRVLQHIDLSRFKVRFYEMRLDGKLLPDMSLPIHQNVAAVEFPLRALVIEKYAA